MFFPVEAEKKGKACRIRDQASHSLYTWNHKPNCGESLTASRHAATGATHFVQPYIHLDFTNSGIGPMVTITCEVMSGSSE
ncbi:hypothetical protein RHMOL_Rhmol07G0045700 [Rhododendron molle]|uniref:Uncharacterized protein n=1 Tax=Rhododendron molle TaxID=49168 RepID=A0ACC0MWX5_RHOML|nr:hypothetical protein RHMOL_Rhmol07G0045700 [Rhododendron molle]